MPKVNVLKLVFATILILIMSVSCTHDSMENPPLECKEMYFKDISDGITLAYAEGIQYSYYYNIDSEYEITFELVLYNGDQIIDKLEIRDVKKDIGDIDGTFGMSANIDEKNEGLVWTIRHDENTKSFTSTNFFKKVKGSQGSYMDGQRITSKGSLIMSEAYNIDRDEDEKGNKAYEWHMTYKMYATKVIKED